MLECALVSPVKFPNSTSSLCEQGVKNADLVKYWQDQLWLSQGPPLFVSTTRSPGQLFGSALHAAHGTFSDKTTQPQV